MFQLICIYKKNPVTIYIKDGMDAVERLDNNENNKEKRKDGPNE